MPFVEDIEVSQDLPALSKGPVTRQMLVEWCAAENDYYTLHYDERTAAAMNVPGTLIQGTFKYALMGQAVQRWLGAGGVLNQMTAQYRGLNLEGERITAHGRVAKVEPSGRVTLEIWIESESGERTTEGVAIVTLPRRG